MKNSEIFEFLNSLKIEDNFWKNKWMFTQPVFWSMSRQGTSLTEFLKNFKDMKATCSPELIAYIRAAVGMTISEHRERK